MSEHSEQHAIFEAIVLTDARRGVLTARLRAEAEALGHKLEGLEGVEGFGVMGDKWLCTCGAYVAALVAGDEVLDTVWNPAALAPCPLAAKEGGRDG